MKIIFLFVFTLDAFIFSTGLDVTCRYLKDNFKIHYYMPSLYYSYYFYDFSSIENIKFQCSLFNLSSDLVGQDFNFIFASQQKIMLDKPINFNFLHIGGKLMIRLTNIKGFNANSVIYENLFVYENRLFELDLYLVQSNFDFYLEDKLVNKMCLVNVWESLMWHIWSRSFIILPSVVFMKDEYCPFIFKNSRIVILRFYRFYASSIINSYLVFSNSNYSIDFSINSNIFMLKASFYQNKLDNRFVNKLIFKKQDCFSL